MFGCVTGPDAGAMGLHYVNGTIFQNGTIDAEQPTIMIYEPTADGKLKLLRNEGGNRRPWLNVELEGLVHQDLQTNNSYAIGMKKEVAARLGDVRVGEGYDVHPFGPGDHVMICGVAIPHEVAPVGHSDADVGLHALTDAVLGAIGAGDIGMHFPPSDPRWRGASSDRFLAYAAALVRERGGAIAAVDVTVICERPKIAPHRDRMIRQVAAILEISADRVSVKATTTERLGFLGRGEGIAAQAVATVRLPL